MLHCYSLLFGFQATYVTLEAAPSPSVAVLGKNIWGGGWPLIIWEATTTK